MNADIILPVECMKNSMAFARRDDQGELIFVSEKISLDSTSRTHLSPLYYFSNYVFRVRLGCPEFSRVLMHSLNSEPGRKYQYSNSISTRWDIYIYIVFEVELEKFFKNQSNLVLFPDIFQLRR